MANNIGFAIKTIRLARKMNSSQLAERAGVSKPYVSFIEAGTRKTLVFPKLQAIADALGVPVAILVLWGEDDKTIDQYPGLRDIMANAMMRIQRERMNDVEEPLE